LAAGSTKVFPGRRNGDQRILSTGGYKSTLTNLATGETIDIKYFGRVEYVFHADGTVGVTVSGGTLTGSRQLTMRIRRSARASGSSMATRRVVSMQKRSCCLSLTV